MLRNHFIIAFRNIRRDKGHAFINVIGLSIGLAGCILIFLFVRNELSHDRFHTYAERTYRLTINYPAFGQSISIPAITGPRMLEYFPEVEKAARLRRTDPVIQIDSELYRVENFFYTDPAFFEIFDFHLKIGDGVSVLQEPYTLIITESVANRFFGTTDVVGRTIEFVNDNTYTIRAVAEDPPLNSHITFNFLASFESLGSLESPWQHQGYLYLLLTHKDAEIKLQTKLDDISMGGHERFMEIFSYYVAGMSHTLQPLTSIHLHSNLDREIKPPGDIQYIYIFSAVAIIILLIACVNYINLATARATRRSLEVGVRKVLGASRTQLVRQFLAESFILSALALIIALVVVELTLPLFNNLSGKELFIPYTSEIFFMLSFPVIIFLLGLFSGGFPAFILAKYKPVTALKKIKTEGPAGLRLRKVLVVIQYVISISLIIAVMVTQNQIRYIQDKHLGFNKEHIVQIPLYDLPHNTAESLKHEINRLAGTTSVSLATGSPLKASAMSSLGEDEESFLVRYVRVDHDYVRTTGIEIVEGRDFDIDIPGDKRYAAIVNETAIDKLGLEGIGDYVQVMRFSDRGSEADECSIIGIVHDFHHGSLREPILPTILYIDFRFFGHLIIRLQPGPVGVSINDIETVWRKFIDNQPFSYSFLDEEIDALYLSEKRFATVLSIFASLAIFLGALGLFGLASFTAEHRTKEIGIRKVLGATVTNIVTLISKDFVKLVLIAAVISAPMAYFIMGKWLENFAYRIDIGFDILILSALIALLLAIVTVSYNAVKAALSNPVDSLRYE